MRKLLYIDACPRGNDSRTKRIAERMAAVLSAEFETERLELCSLDLRPIDYELYRERQNGNIPEQAKNCAKAVADADLILIAAPFWDMSFPSILKVFIEQVTLEGITFCDTPDGTRGSCKAEKILYVTSRGMNIYEGDPLEQATPYLKAVGYLWGINEVVSVSAAGMDMVGDDEREERIKTAIMTGERLCKELANG